MKGSDVFVSMYWFEDIFYKSKNVNTTDFPLLFECEFLNMEIEESHNSDSVCCGFVYYRQKMGVPYIDVYIWDVMLEGGCTCPFEYNESDMLDYHLNRLKSLSLRADYYYIPKAEYLEVSYKVDSEINIYLDAIVGEIKDVQQVCHSMINQYISIFSLDD